MRRALIAPLASLLLGCSSTPAEAPPAAQTDAGTTAASVTFHEHVEPILQRSCQDCHRPGGLGPFSMLTYRETRPKAGLIKLNVADRTMPPWGADETTECKPPHPLRHDLRLPQKDIDTIVQWVEEGAVEGDPAKAPPAKTFPDVTFQADVSVPTSQWTVAPGGADEFRCFVVDPKLTEETWFEALAVEPGNTKIAHHVVLYADASGAAVKKAGTTGSYPCFGGVGVAAATTIGGWVPGSQPTTYAPGAALRLAAGTVLVAQMHYHPTTESQSDSTKLSLRKATSTPVWEARMRLFGVPVGGQVVAGPGDTAGPQFLIPAGAKGHIENVEMTMPSTFGGQPFPELRIAGVTPHMHWLGKDMKIDVERVNEKPGQPKTQCLLQAPRYDFNWQRGYAYDAPIESLPTLNAGDKLRIRCTYDNSMDNDHLVAALQERKLVAPVDVRIGEETLDEMCLGGFTLYTKIAP